LLAPPTPLHSSLSLHDALPISRGINREEERPTLSVVVPAFNAGDFIEKCLNSILAQEGVALEVLVVDDGSNDDTAAKAEQIAERDRKSTRLNSSHVSISYAVFC